MEHFLRYDGRLRVISWSGSGQGWSFSLCLPQSWWKPSTPDYSVFWDRRGVICVSVLTRNPILLERKCMFPQNFGFIQWTLSLNKLYQQVCNWCYLLHSLTFIKSFLSFVLCPYSALFRGRCCCLFPSVDFFDSSCSCLVFDSSSLTFSLFSPTWKQPQSSSETTAKMMGSWRKCKVMMRTYSIYYLYILQLLCNCTFWNA